MKNGQTVRWLPLRGIYAGSNRQTLSAALGRETAPDGRDTNFRVRGSTPWRRQDRGADIRPAKEVRREGEWVERQNQAELVLVQDGTRRADGR